MPIDPSTTPAAGTTRRTFLVRSALGGALVTAGAVAAPTLGLLPAGAQAEEVLLTDAQFAAFATPFELAAVIGYQQAIASEKLDAAWLDRARQFQTNHQSIVDLLTTLLHEGDPAPVADAEVSSQLTDAVQGAGNQAGILQALAEFEEILAATHLSAVPLMREASTSRTITQVVATESQQAVLLGADSGASFEELTPAESTTDVALAISTSEAEPTTTTTAAEASTDESTTTTAGN